MGSWGVSSGHCRKWMGEVVHPLSRYLLGIMANMRPGTVRDTDCITYRCFLPDLTRFMTVCCAVAGRRPIRFVDNPSGGNSAPRKRISGIGHR